MSALTSSRNRRLAFAGVLAGVALLAIACGDGGDGGSSVPIGSGDGSGGSGDPPPFPSVLNLREVEGGSVGVLKGEGNAVTLTARADAGYAFNGWECPVAGMCPAEADGSGMAEITVAVGRDLTLMPVFVRRVTLDLAAGADGRATADCEPDCELDAGTEVMLRAIADAGFRFRGWECEGAATCSSFDRGSAVAVAVVTEDSVLTPLFEREPEVTLAVQDGPGGTIVLDVQCGEGCDEDGRGWRAVVRAVPDAGHLFGGWRCVGAGSCPSAVADATGTTLEFVPEESLVITADFEESSFSVVSDAIYDFSLTTRSVERQALCSGQNDCIFLVGATAAELTAQGDADDRLSYSWELSEGSGHLRLEGGQGAGVTVRGSNGIREILVSTLEARGTRLDDGQVLRDSVTVVAIPPARAVQVGFGCSGSVILVDGQHYVLTAGHCVLQHEIDDNGFVLGRELREGPVDIKLLTGGEGQSLGSMLRGVDELADLALLEISDPGLPWVPTISMAGSVPVGTVVRAVGRPVTNDELILERFEPLVAESAVAERLDSCAVTEGSMDAAIGPFTECTVPEFGVRPDFAGPGSSGGPILNAAHELVGVVTAGVIAVDGAVTTRGAGLDGGGVLEPLLAGGIRCEELEVARDEDTVSVRVVGVNDCTGSKGGGGR